ncbi:MAG: hypothetical protein ACLPNY_20510, partial [Roseiarcus sp.]
MPICAAGRLTRVGAAAALAALGVAAARAQPAPANTLRELFAQLDRCLVAAGGAPGPEIPVGVSRRRDGAQRGQPRIYFARLNGDA